MSLRLTKPGLSAAVPFKIHPKTGAPIEPLYVRADGSVVWPVLGAASDDPDDPAFTDDSTDDDEDDEDDEDEPEEDDKKTKSKSKAKSKKDEDDDEDDDDEDDKEDSRPHRQAARYRTQLREAQRQNKELNDRLKALEDKDKKPDEIASRDLTEARERAEKLEARARTLSLQNAFLRANDVQWNDPEDALKLLDFDEIDVDEDGTVDQRQLRRALRDLAKRKPHLVKPKQSSGDDDEEDEDEPRSTRSASTMNGRRKGTRGQSDRKSLAKKFPVLQNL